MSASNGGVQTVECETFYTTVQKPFPKVTSEGKIETIPFLEAAKGVVALVELFGPVFAPVKNDMMGNIQKLRGKYDEDQNRFIYLNDMILAEKEKGGYFAISALLWLRRGLELIYMFCTHVIEQTEGGNASEDLRPLLQQAYQETLEKYHGWMSKQLFKLVCQMCPYRKDLMLALALGQEGIESSVISHLSSFLIDLRRNTQAVYKLYEDNGIDLEAKS